MSGGVEQLAVRGEMIHDRGCAGVLVVDPISEDRARFPHPKSRLSSEL